MKSTPPDLARFPNTLVLIGLRPVHTIQFLEPVIQRNYSTTRETFLSRTCMETIYSIAMQVPLDKVSLVILNQHFYEVKMSEK